MLSLKGRLQSTATMISWMLVSHCLVRVLIIPLFTCTIPFLSFFYSSRIGVVYMYNTLHLTRGHLPSSLYWKVSRFFKVPYSKEHSPILVIFASILKHVLFLDRPYLSLQFLHIIFIIIVILLMQVLASFLGISKLNDTEGRKKERKKERKKGKNAYSVLYSILKFDQTYKKMEYMYTYFMVRTNNYIVY